jgi:hypothetical protein
LAAGEQTTVEALAKKLDRGNALEKLAQNERGVKRATQRAGKFLCCMAAHIRALCAL